MKRFVDFYRKHYKQKLFNKILTMYAIITIVSLATLSAFVYTYLNTAQVQKELDLNKQILADIGSHLDIKHATSQQIIQQIYRDGSSALLSDVLSFLQNNFSDYLNKRLLQYSATGVRTPDINSFLRLLLVNNPDIRAVALYSKDKKFIFTLTKDTQNYYFDDADLQTVISKYISTDRSYTTISNINNMTTQESVGNLIIDYDSTGIYRTFQDKTDEMKGYVVVLTPEGNVIFDSSNRYYGQKYPFAPLLNNPSSIQRFEEESYMNLQTTNKFGFWIVGIIPKSTINGNMKGLKNTLILVTVICIAAAMTLTYFTIVNFSRRTKVIVQAMKKVQDGDLSVRIPREKEDELFQISSRFNQMCEDLTQYIDRVYKSEIREKHAELVAFQAQIKPHFLYNTLEAIRMRALSKKADDVGEMIYILATLFRYSVKSETIVKISDEIEYCRLYLDLFRIRLLQKFTYEINIEPEWMSIPILKLSIQPIIENYIIHGLKMSQSDNHLSISAEWDGRDLQLLISDNGNGIEPLRLKQLRSSLEQHPPQTSDSIGLINVNERLKICFGSGYGLHINSEPGQGTVISVKIPAGQGGQQFA
ncbi:sensor histidine kinase [Paenibacillus sp. PL91]|uniref:sensor histidine kinase n=1 Tax=Paenibacillus sp. PL91 TaxID=2729538 RepID=UPI00145D03D6|nr:histidine kinase [Paenibacillus sp. PL91]MBC9203029.1 sensor histidine kinase [Paenibacillus sp. PL91]